MSNFESSKEALIALEEIRKQILEILEEENDSYFLSLFFIMNYKLIKKFTAEEFRDKYFKIYNIMKNNEKLNKIFDLNN